MLCVAFYFRSVHRGISLSMTMSNIIAVFQCYCVTVDGNNVNIQTVQLVYMCYLWEYCRRLHSSCSSTGKSIFQDVNK